MIESSHIPQTYLLSLLLSVLSALAPAYSMGPPALSSSTLENLSRTVVFPLSLPIKAACLLLSFAEDDGLKGKDASASANARVVRNDMWVRLFAELRFVFVCLPCHVLSDISELSNSPQTPPSTALLFPSISTLVFAWLGTIPLALDWDRPWQEYPLTTAYVAIVGYVLGGLGALTWSTVKGVWKEIKEDESNRKSVGTSAGVVGGKTKDGEVVAGRKKGKKN